jgi:hypothetical protein
LRAVRSGGPPAGVSPPLFEALFGSCSTFLFWGYLQRAVARRRPGGLASMYCDTCRRQLYYKDPNSKGWCFSCNKVVDITQCGVSHWNLMAVFTMLWTLQIG